MRLRTFLLFVVLLCLIGLCSVHESSRQTRIRYRMAELLSEEQRLRQDLLRLRAELAALTSPTTLESAGRETVPDLAPLLPVPELGDTPDRVAARK